jgi:nucleoside-diphosphate-sugar epimerase
MKILVIGAQYTGRAAAVYWRRQGHSVTVTTTREARVAELRDLADAVTVLRGSDLDKLRAALPGHDAVLMSVAGGMVEKEGQVVLDPDAYRDTYLGTAQALAAALADAPSVKQVIFPSSTSAYGSGGGLEIVNEDTPPTPQNVFQQVYVETEQTLLGAAGVKVCLLRTGNIYGPGRELRAQAAAMSGRVVPLDGNSGAMIIHRDDVARAADFALTNGLRGVYNVVNDIAQTKREFFGALCESAGWPAIQWSPFGAGPRHASNAKLKTAGFVFADPDATRESEDLLA